MDCNNFYASCERVFNPALNGKPIVVLSNNDGCVIARSNEAKTLGIKMGVPAYQIKDDIQKYGISVFSSNYTLYGDMSGRVMSILAEQVPEMEVYSIDEAFLNLEGIRDIQSLGTDIINKVIRGTGIPVSLGIAPTKTLAKVANKFAKKVVKRIFFCVIFAAALDNEDGFAACMRFQKLAQGCKTCVNGCHLIPPSSVPARQAAA